VFERYTENARRAIFFARYECSQFGAAEISVEHFLLGVLREDGKFAARMPLAAVRERIEKHSPRQTKISTSVDLPLSVAVKRVLAFSAEAAERLGHSSIGTQHHLLGILREPSFAADLLREYGLDETVVKAGVRSPTPQPIASILEGSVRDLHELLQVKEVKKETIGHLIDCAIAFHQWLASTLVGGAEPFELPARRLGDFYESAPGSMLLELWKHLNSLLVHMLYQTQEEFAEPIASATAAYTKHCSAAAIADR
jgi:Clp amino terminal domain, pathogenicity island component